MAVNMTADAAPYDALAKHLANQGYTFICPSPETQGRVVARRRSSLSSADAKDVVDFFGWNLPCSRVALRSMIPDSLIDKLHKASVLETNADDKYTSRIRISNFYLPAIPDIDGHGNATPLYYYHSSFPANTDAVFFGPDSYLFTSFLRTATRHLQKPPRSVIDVCCGAGVGAIHMASTYPLATTYGLDLNSRALHLGAVNAHLAGVTVGYLESDLFASVPVTLKDEGVDVIVSNPPYIASTPNGHDLPVYADGGAHVGLELSFRIVEEGAKMLSTNGTLFLYTGVPILAASPERDALLERLRRVDGMELVEYMVMHPDMWSEEIGRGAYVDVGRIQAVGAVLRQTG